MSNIAWPQEKNFAFREVAAAEPMTSGESGVKRTAWSRWLHLCASILILAGVALYSTSIFAGTPHSQTRSCGTAGLPICPSQPPIVTPWTFVLGNTLYNSEAELGAAWEAAYANAPGGTGYCSLNLTYTAPYTNPPPQYIDGLETRYYAGVNLARVWGPGLNPPCAYNDSVGYMFTVFRNVYCPTGLTLTYQSSPLVGPYCTLPSATANPLKQIGSCPTCSGVTTKSDPVNVSNGNAYQTETDYVGGGTSPLKFTRSYNSLSAYLIAYYSASRPAASAIMGEGWSATYFQFLLPITVTDSTTTYNTVYAYRPDGRVLTFNKYNGVYSPDGDVVDSLVPVSGGGWQYQAADDTIETYDANGQLVSIAARGQAPLTISRPGAFDLPSSVSDAFGHKFTFSYANDSQGVQRLNAITDSAGKIIQYAYDGNGNLTSVTYPDTTTRKYAYTASVAKNALTSLTDENNVAYASWTYSIWADQVATSQLAGGVAAYSFTYATNNGTITSATVIDPLGQSRTYAQQLVSGVNRTTTTSSACPGCGDDQVRVLDAAGNITSRTDWNGNQTTYVYNTTSNLETSRTEAYGTPQARSITTSWDPNWRQPDLITEPNRTTAFTYDGMGNVLTKTITDTATATTRIWTYTYDTYGRMLTADGPRTDVIDKTTYTYYTCTTGSQCGQLHTISNALGQVTTFNTYNLYGQPLTITDPNGTVTTLTYDLRQRLLSRQVSAETTTYSYYPTGLLKLVTLPDTSTILYGYDAAHRLTDITDGINNHIHYTLDAMGNRTADNTYDPSSTLRRTHTRVINTLNEVYQDVNAAGTAAVTTTLGYDNNGNLLSSAAPLSRNTSNQYDPLNRLKQITDPNAGITKFSYDGNDNLQTVIDPRNLTTTYAHNGFGDVTQLVSPDTGTSNSTYDSGGNLKTVTDARSAAATYSYDALNRVTQVAYTDQTINFTYDAGTNGIGRLTGASDASHSMSWAHDTLGRVSGKGQTVASITKSVGYSYSNGELTSIVTPSGQTITYTYTNHRIASVAINSTTVLSGATYDPFGPATGWTWGNSTASSRTFDTDGRQSQIVTAGVTNGYTVDNASHITGISDSGLSSNSFTFGYDLLDRVTSGVSSTTSRGYTYDANSNRLTTTGTTASTETIATTSNQLNSTSGNPARTYGYDAAGNTTSFTGDTFTFNKRSRMSVATVGGSSTNYVYNALGQLIEKSGNGGTTLLVYDEAGHLLGEYSNTGALVQETIWMGDTPVATLRPNGSTGCTSTLCIFYVHTDHLGTPRKVTRPSDNALMWRWDPDSFGSVAPNQNPGGVGTYIYNLRFPGQYYMAETGLFYNYFRTYDPQMGRYLESDPMGLRGGTNPYAYVLADPISGRDPLGLFDWPPSFPQGVVNASAGLGDALLFGLGAHLRKALNIDGGVNSCSATYASGQIAGIIGTFLTGEGEANLIFKTGHYAERLVAEGVDVGLAEAAVANEIRAMEAGLAEGENLGALSGRITVGGTPVQYNAFPLPGGQINIGTIFPIKW